jgi:hypothetical protein
MRRQLGFAAALVVAAATLMVGAGGVTAGGQPTLKYCEGGHTVSVPNNESVYFFYLTVLSRGGAFILPPLDASLYDLHYEAETRAWIGYYQNDPPNVPGLVWVAVSEGPCPPTVGEPQGPDRYIYCAGAGDVGADGKPLGLGQTLNLKFGEQVGSPYFPNATLGFWVQGLGLTCQLTPAQAALAAASTVKVNHTGAANTQEGAQVYTFVPA